MNLSNLLKDPFDIILLLIYVTGVLTIVYSAMQLLHGYLYKEKQYICSGIMALLLSVLMLMPRLVYQHIRTDGSDYKKYVKSSLQAIENVYKDHSGNEAENEKTQLDALSGRLAGYGYDVNVKSFVETTDINSGKQVIKTEDDTHEETSDESHQDNHDTDPRCSDQENKDSLQTVRYLSAVKKASVSGDSSDIILISTALPCDSSRDGFSEGAGDIAVLESLAQKLSALDADFEIRFMISKDGREGQDAAYRYIESLSEEEKARIACDISFDMKALSDYTGFEIYTANGINNPVASSLSASLKKMTGQKTSTDQDKHNCSAAFHINGIPSAYLRQATVEKAGSAKSIEDISQDEVADASAVIGDIILGIAKRKNALLSELGSSDKTVICSGSFRKGKDVFSSDNVSLSNSSSEFRRICENFAVSLTETGDTDGNGRKLYSGHLYILNFDSPVSVLFHFRGDGLSKVTIDSKDTGKSKEEMQQILSNLFGEAEESDGTYFWKDTDGSAIYQLSQADSSEALRDMTSGGYSLCIVPG
ncbi:hypothetical protein [Oribacterium sp. WCC10]|uniref:hypothetical protein n=1 Tax=Oribacterium sp. WCC10 TaxID=1855343 RepID=UPI0008E07661|nr:hypothetical protein [Oribacterium sp. WCC10]SFG51729.1 hypothetical protein SAMN05216356_11176 [Oribacterium sp. WCC10]